MKFKVGDKIKLIRPSLHIANRHVGAVGEILGYKSYCRRLAGDEPTHYVVKFDCYKRSHEYMEFEIENNCELIN